MPNLRRAPWGRFQNFVWWWLTRNAEQADVQKMKARLWIPPKGEEPKGVWSPEAETDAFNALQRSLSS